MGCIDAEGRLTRSAELIMLAMIKPATVDEAAHACGLPLFRIRSAVRELVQAKLLRPAVNDCFYVSPAGIRKLEGQDSRVEKPRSDRHEQKD